MNLPVTVCITTYNREDLLANTINSVLNQTYRKFELIIIDDCSTDNTEGLVNTIYDDRLRYVRHKQNKGLAAARNTGIKEAKSKYIAFLDDDDEWLPKKLQEQVNLIESSEADVVYCGNVIIDKNNKIVRKGKPEIKGNIRSEIVKKGLSTIPSSCFFRKEALEAVGGFDENLESHIDHDIWMKMAEKNYKADYVDQALVVIYQNNRAKMTADNKSRLKATKVYLKKWGPEIKKWFGEKQGENYCREFYIKILGRLGMEALKQKKFKNALTCWSKAFFSSPLIFFKRVKIYIKEC